MYHNILYPTDGSTGSKTAATHAKAIASAFDATVHVLHVVDSREGGLGVSGAFIGEGRRGMSGQSADKGYIGRHEDRPDLEEIGESLAEHARELFGASPDSSDGIAVTTAVETGTPHSVILRYADENDIDLVVMGTHGRTGVERYLLGSVTEKVVRLADRPVVTVRSDEDA